MTPHWLVAGVEKAFGRDDNRGLSVIGGELPEPILSPKEGDKDGAAALPTSVGVRVETEKRFGCVVEKKQQVPPLGLKPSVGMTRQWSVARRR
jgi:hypothetical protein